MSDCPSAEKLEAFAKGGLSAAEREAVASHAATCSSCAPRLLPLVLAQGRRADLSPEAQALSEEMLGDTVTRPSSPRSLDEKAPPPDAVNDTVVSGERTDPGVVQRLEIGVALDRYVVLSRLGGGGMGEVYAAWDPALDRKVALKLLRADFKGSAREEEFRRRLLREAQALAKLSHQNVVSIHDVGVAKGTVFLAMEFAEGETLTKWLKDQPRGWRRIVSVFLEAGEGLAAAHATGITHRDFKPDNVVVGKDDRVRVMDFGLAHGESLTDSDVTEPTKPLTQPGIKRAITAPGTVLGTPAYMSPEALFGKPTDARSDVFSFCVALYEALYGQRPFEGATSASLAAAIQQGKTRPVPRDTKVPGRIHRIILKGLDADPARRFQTLRALLLQLGRRTAEQRRRFVTLGAVLAAVAALAVTGGLVRREQQRCAQVERRLDGVWDQARRTAGKDAFLKTGKPWATSTWAEVERELDAYARGWVGLRRATCEAHDEASDASAGRHLLCLSRRVAELDAVAQLFSRADADIVERAVATANALPPVELCLREEGGKRMRAPEQQELRAGLSAAKARLDASKVQDGVDQARAVAAAALQAGDQLAVAEAKLLLGIGTARLGDLKGADQFIEEAVLAATTAQDDELVARGYVERVGVAALGAGRPEDGERWARFARAAVDRVGAPLELEATLANNLGVLAWSRGRAEDAIASHRKALELRSRLFGPESPLTARAHTNLGTDLKAAGRASEAETEYRTALAIEEKVLTPEHPAVAETLNNLANVLLLRRDLRGAREAMERALAIKEREAGPESLTVAVTLTNLGALLLDAGATDKAEVALVRALRIKEAISGADSLTVASTLSNLAEVRRRQQRWDDAVLADTRALDIRKARLGVGHKDLASNYTGLGRTRLLEGKGELARVSLEQALLLRAEPGPGRGETSLWLARAYLTKKGGEKRARELLEQAVADLAPEDATQAEARQLLAKLVAP